MMLFCPRSPFLSLLLSPQSLFEGVAFMSSLTLDVETTSAQRHKRLAQWVAECAQLCKPERVHWCDGSSGEYQAMMRLMILSGTAIPLSEDKRPNSILVRSSPAD